jgi:hypothetical protein
MQAPDVHRNKCLCLGIREVRYDENIDYVLVSLIPGCETVLKTNRCAQTRPGLLCLITSIW